jgi:two-component system, sensor histidine kinase and response regulator
MLESVVQNLAQARQAILIVDDSATNLVAYQAVLESLAYDIVTATSGTEAVALFERQQFALLLIDVRMPGMDGFATVELLRSRLQKFTPVIFVTGSGDDESMRRAYEFGAVDYLVKPVQPDVLRGKVRNLLTLYEMAKELEHRSRLVAEKHQRLLEANVALRNQDTNIGVLAHDLRSPLNAILTSVSMLKNVRANPDKVATVADRIDRSAHRMASLIRDILDFARGRIGDGIPVTRRPMDLGSVSQAVADEIQAAHPVARIEVKTAGRLTGEWDQARLEQAISNLLSNAIQHGAGGPVTVTASGHEDDHVIVTVRNEGEPIPPERLPLLFEPFQKGDKSPAGLGLGLFIVREIIKAHSGTVVVSSSNAGTMFTVRLPRADAGVVSEFGFGPTQEN